MRATVRLLLRKYYTSKTGKQQLCLRYISHKRDTYIGLGISIHPKNWDSKSLMIRKGEYKTISEWEKFNKIITEAYQKAVNLIIDNHTLPLTFEQFRDQLTQQPSSDVSFYNFIANELEILKVYQSSK